MRVSVLRTLGVLLLAVAVTAPALADSAPVLNRIVERGEFRVGMSGAQPPFTAYSKQGDMIGFEVDLAKLLADAMGVRLTIIQRPFPQLLQALDKGEVDAVMSGMTMTPARNLRAAFVGPYVLSGKSILTKDKNLAMADDAADVDREGITLVTLANSTSQSFVEKLMPRAKLVTVDDYDQAVKMVLADKATAMVADFPICALSVLRHKDQGLVTLREPMTIEPIGMALAPGDSLLLNMVENYLSALEAAGLLKELKTKWFEDGSWLINLP
jgi:polar amino acid transport system substrate-binding protein